MVFRKERKDDKKGKEKKRKDEKRKKESKSKFKSLHGLELVVELRVCM